MPRVKLLKKPSDPVKALLFEHKIALRLSDEQMAVKMGVSKSTYERRMHEQHTDQWSVGELKRLSHSLGVPMDELRGAIKY